MSVLRSTCLLSLGSLALVLATPTLADETFLCEDGKLVTVTSANRETMQEHPCVKKWFTKEAETRAAKAAAAEEKPTGQGYAGGVARGTATAALNAARSQGSSQGRTVRVYIHRTRSEGEPARREASRPRFRLRRR